QVIASFLNLYFSFLKEFEGVFNGAMGMTYGLELVDGVMQPAGAAVFVFLAGLHGDMARRQNAFGLAKAFLLLFQLLYFPFFQSQLFQFLGLIGQQLNLSLHFLALAGELLQALALVLPALEKL